MDLIQRHGLFNTGKRGVNESFSAFCTYMYGEKFVSGTNLGQKHLTNNFLLILGKVSNTKTSVTCPYVRFISYETSKTYSSNGAYKSEVTSTNPNAYPNNGYQGGNWYVLQGVR